MTYHYYIFFKISYVALKETFPRKGRQLDMFLLIPIISQWLGYKARWLNVTRVIQSGYAAVSDWGNYNSKHLNDSLYFSYYPLNE